MNPELITRTTKEADIHYGIGITNEEAIAREEARDAALKGKYSYGIEVGVLLAISAC